MSSDRRSAFDGYVICATPRTGSTLLCDLLTATGYAGNPDSYFGGRFIDWWAEQWGLSPRGQVSDAEFNAHYLNKAIEVGKGGTDLFGLRLMRENVVDVVSIIGGADADSMSDRQHFERALGRLLYVHLSREDKLAQAVSLVKAEQTGLWHIAPDGSEVERLAPHQDPVYDFGRLKAQVEELEAYDAAWNEWFSEQQINPLCIGYETLAADPAASLIKICKALGVEPPDAASVEPGVAKLGDELSLEWMRRYRSDAARS